MCFLEVLTVLHLLHFFWELIRSMYVSKMVEKRQFFIPLVFNLHDPTEPIRIELLLLLTSFYLLLVTCCRRAEKFGEL